MHPSRLLWLDGLRGIGAVQVLLLHTLGAFLPAWINQPSAAWPLFDGECAVFVFFLMSGAVLTGAFSGQTANIPAQIAARLVRFALPATASLWIAFAVFRLLPGEHLLAGAVLPGSWLTEHWVVDGSAPSLLTDLLQNALLLGYRDLSLLGAEITTGAAYNAPLWTLSLELQGSALVLALVWLRRRSPAAWLALSLFLGVLLLRTPLLCFVAGHVALVASRPGANGRAGLALLLAGGALACATPIGTAEIFTRLAAADLPMARAFPAEMMQRCVAAMLLLAGLCLSRPPRCWLERPGTLWLGRLSFPLYLTHWPVIFGPGAWIFLAAAPALGPDGAALLAAAGSIVLSLSLARLFRPIDEAAIRLARHLRRWLAPRPLSAMRATAPAVSA